MNLPTAISRYFDAANRFDATEASLCFTEQALVHDENQDQIGRDAIRAWVQDTSEKYHPKFELINFQINNNEVSLTSKISGTFPGSPIELDYKFILEEGLISKLLIE